MPASVSLAISRRIALFIFICVGLAACSGIPLTSIPRLLQLSNQLSDVKASEFMVAIQLDARMTPPAGGVPVVEVRIEPAVAGAFEVIDKKLPMRLANTANSAQGAAMLRSLTLPAAPNGRRWLVYSFTPESQAEIQRVQLATKRLMLDKQSGSGPGKGGTKAYLGIAQEGIPARDPAFANTRWESWLQTRQDQGFFELWAGTVGTLLKQAGPPKP